MRAHHPQPNANLDAILEADAWARRKSAELLR
jgi:hypothetical protein